MTRLAVESPDGVQIQPDAFSDEHLAALDAKIDVEDGEDGTICARFPTLRRPASRSEPVKS